MDGWITKRLTEHASRPLIQVLVISISIVHSGNGLIGEQQLTTASEDKF